MKHIFIILFLFLFLFNCCNNPYNKNKHKLATSEVIPIVVDNCCNNSYSKHKSELAESESTPAVIDTLEFIDFWDNFRSAVLSRDTTLLALMSDDEIVDDCFLQPSDIGRTPLTKLWESLFTCSSIALMENYNIKDDLDAFTKDYRCEIFLTNERYRASVDFNIDNTISYRMSLTILGDYFTHGTDIHLLFRKKDKKPIKLYKIDCSEISISAGRLSGGSVGTENIKPGEPFSHVEEMPQFPKGNEAMLHFIKANIRYPESDRKAGIKGKVVLSCVIEKDGTVSNIEVVKKLSPLCDKEAIRVLKYMPKWIPGKQGGVNVAVTYTIMVAFDETD